MATTDFAPFSAAHALGMAMAAAIVVGIVLFRRRFRTPRANRGARYALVAILVVCELSLQAWYGITDNWGLHSLPLQLCSVMMWLSAIALLTRSRRLYEVTFFLGIIGAMQALLTPNLDAGYPEFRYFHFFIAHGAIIGASLFLTAIEGYRPTTASVFRALGWLHVIAVPAAVANALTGANFMFLARKPSTASLLDLLAPWPWYLLQLELVALALCFLMLGIVRLIDRLLHIRAAKARQF
ncbi:putative integral membrane protein (TIGR02206 family) [Cohnella sp. SGD-V74]|uniref:YwaF family protein n=1 Tax=unclassified Cohnella TaxID=2636738 RepID=UPI000D4CE425|nr:MULTISPECIES: TIGR02206 family membrane protein [unclassified Cohnella]PRX60579.1 putative integral membrane protein (TIGR02206 family) [Cohnella sp. SGD-V74]